MTVFGAVTRGRCVVVCAVVAASCKRDAHTAPAASSAATVHEVPTAARRPTVRSTLPPFTWTRIGDNREPTLGSVWSNGIDLLVASSVSHVLCSTDQGATWTRHRVLPQRTEGDESLGNLSGSGNTVHVTSIIAGEGALFESSDGCRTWSRRVFLRQMPMHALWSSSEAELVFADLLHGIHRSTDHGKTYRSWQTPLIGQPRDTAGLDSELLTVGCYGVIYHSTDRGESWSVQKSTLGEDTCLEGVAFSARGHAVAVGGVRSGVIVRTEDGGSSWSKAHQSDLVLDSVASAAPWDYTVVGRSMIPPYRRAILRSRDDGVSWAEESIAPARKSAGSSFEPEIARGDVWMSEQVGFAVSGDAILRGAPE